MGKVAHTPGPWEVADAGMYKAGRYDLDEYFVRRPDDDVAIASDIVDPSTSKPCMANARLIAAAPDMLEALNEINNWLVCAAIATPEDMAQSFQYMQQVAESAINKAKGNQ